METHLPILLGAESRTSKISLTTNRMTKDDLKLNIKELYNEGQSDYTIYNWLIGASDGRGMHFGFWNENTCDMDQALMNENQYVMDKLDLQPNDHILDAGCGVGGPAIYLSKKYGVKIIGITLAEKQVTKSKVYAARNGVKDLLQFKTMDYHRTDFPDNTFDKIYSIESADAANPVTHYIKEMFRILKPGGKLLILDAFLSKLIEEYEGTAKENLDDLCNSWALPDPRTVDDWKNKLIQQGFGKVETEDLTLKVLKTSRIIKSIANYVRPVYKILYCLGIIPRARYANSIAAWAQGFLFDKRLLEYHSILAVK